MNKRNRRFSTTFKKEKVEMIERKELSISELCKIYDVSTTSVYKWIQLYSDKIPKGERVVIEKESEAHRCIALLKQSENLERVIGQQQVKIEYLEKVISLINEELGYDIKKKLNSKQ